MKTAGIVLLILLGVLLLILFLGCAFVFNQLVWRKTIPVPKFIEKMKRQIPFMRRMQKPPKPNFAHCRARMLF